MIGHSTAPSADQCKNSPNKLAMLLLASYATCKLLLVLSLQCTRGGVWACPQPAIMRACSLVDGDTTVCLWPFFLCMCSSAWLASPACPHSITIELPTWFYLVSWILIYCWFSAFSTGLCAIWSPELNPACNLMQFSLHNLMPDLSGDLHDLRFKCCS